MTRNEVLLCNVAAVAAVTMGLSCSRHGASPPAPSAPATIQLTSAAFEANQPIPRRHTGEGEDLSPPLAWTNLPAGTKELALICDDPDAPDPDRPGKEPWVHWVLARINAGATGLIEGESSAKAGRVHAGVGMLDGRNDFDTIGYGGPMPPPGKPHRYFFRLYALDAPLDLKAAPSKAELLKAMQGHVLAVGELVGTYQR